MSYGQWTHKIIIVVVAYKLVDLGIYISIYLFLIVRGAPINFRYGDVVFIKSRGKVFLKMPDS